MPRIAALGALLVAAEASAATSLTVTLQVDAGTPVTITDSNDLSTDLNAANGTLDFSTTVDGILQADGRATQENAPITRSLTLSSRTAGRNATFRNLDASAHIFTVTVESDVFSAPGKPLGWSVSYEGSADDVAAGTVEIAPENNVAAFVDPGAGFVPLLTTPVSVPITPPVPAADQPVPISADQRGVEATDDAVRTRLVWTFRAGPNDELRLADDAFTAIAVSVFNQEFACVAKMDKLAAQLTKVAGNGDLRCLKQGGDATACVDDPADPKAVDFETKLLKTFANLCTTPPAFGANTGSCCLGGGHHGDGCAEPSDCPGGTCTIGACIGGGAEGATNAIVHDLFGARVNLNDPAAKSCQAGVMKASGADLSVRWKIFSDCKRRNISSLATEADFVATCLGPPQPDEKGSIAKSEQLIGKNLQHCVDHSLGALSTLFPGACASRPDAAYAACVAQRVACRFCLGAESADDIHAPADLCDLFDDGAANDSCP
jgi:hypothetical protein